MFKVKQSHMHWRRIQRKIDTGHVAHSLLASLPLVGVPERKQAEIIPVEPDTVSTVVGNKH